MSTIGVERTDLGDPIEREAWEVYGAESQQAEEAEPAWEEAAPAPPDLSQARLVATEPRPAGLGEVLVTEVWPAPPQAEAEEDRVSRRGAAADADTAALQEGDWTSPERETKTAPPPDRQRQWETRQELRELGLLRERPLVSHDARYEEYWRQVSQTKAEAVRAMVDPYTTFATEFAEVDLEGMRDHQAAAREYGHASESLLALGRAYMVIGRQKSARAALEAAAKAEPNEPHVWRTLGLVRLLGRANQAAREALEHALDQAPGDFPTELALGVAHYHLRDYASAEDLFRRLAGSSGMRATARSMLACSMRMQGHWDDARVELAFLKDARPGDWAALSQQCLDCVERGEQKVVGPLRARRRAGQMFRALAAVAAGGIWIAYSLYQDLFQQEARWAVIPLFVLAILFVRTLRRISGAELPGEFGNAEQGLPCWQTTAWVKPKQSEF